MQFHQLLPHSIREKLDFVFYNILVLTEISSQKPSSFLFLSPFPFLCLHKYTILSPTNTIVKRKYALSSFDNHFYQEMSI